MIIAVLVVALLLSIIGMALWGYVIYFFIAVCAYIFLQPVYRFLMNMRLGKTISGVGSVLIGLVVCITIFAIVSGLIINETKNLFTESTKEKLAVSLTNLFNTLGRFIPGFSPDNVGTTELVNKALSDTADYLNSMLRNIIKNSGNFLLGILIVIFIPYYLLVSDDLEMIAKSLIPFSKKNTEILIKEFKNILYSVIICTGLLALIQAIPLTLAFMYFGIPAAVFLGLVGMLLACIPFLGVPLIWIPVAIIEAINGDYGAAIGISAVGVLVFVIDNMRPLLQKGVGQIHPLVTIIGAVIGIECFGILGILIGPIVLSFALLTVNMFKEEYI
jgi:predicted PurR-regulated permease PerM